MEKGKGIMGSGRRWAVDFSDNSTAPSSRDIPDPPGFTRASVDQDDSTVSRQKKDAESNWKAQKAWEVAQAPFKNLLMMGFMMWMAGNTVHLFSIGITFSALWQPISALQGVGKVFEPYKDNKVDLLGPKLLFIALNLGGLALGVWKLNTLGLLPTHASDWVSSLPPAQSFALSNQGRSPLSFELMATADKINVLYTKLPMVAKSGLTKLVALHIVIGTQSEISVPLRR
ncbi:hypothetical protein Godav_029945 [Gossypium davidsonii]|uniref:ER membrane protein complex subunit 4 n=1 Tax=Gossypium davidsonii TaxID=34287 RepID=A0A7J8TG22_GOSDV|nr:hypothetical protein [Gossypium davidsonii]